MRIPLDRQDPIPLYRQIETFLRQGILSGSFAGTRLPAIRKLARDLGVNRITVESAYAELEAAGLVVCRVGSGTFVLPVSEPRPFPEKDPAQPWPLWQQELLARNRDRFTGPLPDQVSSAVDSLTAPEPDTKYPHVISFAQGSGDPRLFPVQDLRKTIQAVMRHDGATTLKYGDPKGCPSLRGTIVQMLASQGLRTQPENILVTGGSQQALALIVQLLVKPGDTVLLEIPTYSMALNMLRAFNHLKDEIALKCEELAGRRPMRIPGSGLPLGQNLRRNQCTTRCPNGRPRPRRLCLRA